MKFYNAVNPLASGIDVFADPRLSEWAREHAPSRPQKVQILSRADCSDRPDMHILVGFLNCSNAFMRRSAATSLAKSYCPVKTVETLINRGCKPGEPLTVLLDHETPAWLAAGHDEAYSNLRFAIQRVFDGSEVFEYAGVPAPRIGPSEDDWKWNAQSASTWLWWCAPFLYVPEFWLKSSPEGVKELTRFALQFYRDGDIPVISPFINGGTSPDYTSGPVVPAWIHAAMFEVFSEKGITEAMIWSATANAEQAGRVVAAIEESIVKAEGGAA